MTIEQKAPKLARDIRGHAAKLYQDMAQSDLWSCLLLAAEYIEAHELDKSRHAAELASTRRLADEWRSDALASQARHAAEMREQAERFSEAARKALEIARLIDMEAAFSATLSPFILAPVDPLKESLAEAYGSAPEEFVNAFRAALDARGLAIVKKEAVNG